MSKKLLYSKSSPMAAANLAGTSPKKGDDKREGNEDEILPIRGTVAARRRLFQGSAELQNDSPVLSTSTVQLHKLSQTYIGPSSPSSQGVNAASLEDISSLKNLFGKSVSGGPSTVPSPAIRAPKPTWPIASLEDPSLTAAILVTQLSPSSSAQNLGRGSPILNFVSTSARGSPVQRSFPIRLSSPDAIPKLSPPPPLHGSSLLRPSIPSMTSKESVSTEISVKSDSNNAILAAKPESSPNLQSKAQPPKPPPPRRAQTSLKTTSNSKTPDTENISSVVSISSVTTSYSRYDTGRSPMSLKRSPSKSCSSTSLAPPLPQRRLSIGNISRQSTGDTALTAAVFPPTSSRILSTSPAYSNNPQPSPLPWRLTGDSVLATSLVTSRTTSPAPKKPPAPPTLRRGRRRSLSPPSKTCLRETAREPPKSLPKDLDPQSRPRLVKHLPQKHAQGGRWRWRHFVTNKERKRYEELWADNKGLLLASSGSNAKTPAAAAAAAAAASSVHRTKSQGSHRFQHVWSSAPNYPEALEDCIDSLIVRDIWERSRLQFDHLADIWDLVNRGDKGRLSREEFVVGTWLVDQSLKGRKLPTSVQDEVWQSVRRLGV